MRRVFTEDILYDFKSTMDKKYEDVMNKTQLIFKLA